MMNILYFDFTGANFIPSINSLTSSTPGWLAASISIKSMDLPAVISRHESQVLQGFAVSAEALVEEEPLLDSPGTSLRPASLRSQFTALAKILAMVVFPDPRGPENK